MIKNFLILLLSVTFFVGCSSDSDEPVVSGGTAAVSHKTGVFYVTGPVANLHYSTDNFPDEYTNEDGQFKYLEGEEISFDIAGIELGKADGSSIISPFNLIPGAEDASDSSVVSVGAMILSLSSGEFGGVLTLDNALKTYEFIDGFANYEATSITDVYALIEQFSTDENKNYQPVEPGTSWYDDIVNLFSDSNTTNN